MPELIGDSEDGFGIQAHSTSNHGVFSRSEAANGVVGHSNGNPAGGNAGVFGEHLANGTGVKGVSQGGFGVSGHSQSSNGVFAESQTGIGVFSKGGRLAGFFEGDVEVTGDIRLANADCAEDFDVAEAEPIEPGTVMVLGEEGGALHQSRQAYDKRIAGVVSGAAGYKPGIALDKQNTQADRVPLALLGKVYCKVDASYGPIEVGDLLTTSDRPGHAMKAADPLKAFGSIIGKALRPFKEGQGLIPILIALQ